MPALKSLSRSGRIAWLIWFAVMVAAIVVPIVATQVWDPNDTIVESSWFSLWLAVAVTAPLSALGALIASRRPENRLGWLMLGIGVTLVIAVLGDAWGAFARAVSAPAAEWGTAFGDWFSLYPILALVTALPLLFPNGRLPSRRWWPVVALAITAGIVWPPFEELGPANLDNPQYPDAIKIGWLTHDIGAISWLSYVLVGGAVLGSLAALFVRARKSRGIERQQIKWFLYVAAPACVLFILSGSSIDLVANISFTGASILAVFGLPIAITFAVLRYRLFEIDRLISRSISWLLITLVLGGLYLAVVVALGAAFHSATGNGSQLTVAASTLLVAALFRPVRGRVQAAVDRRFNRRHYDTARTVEVFRLRLRDEVELSTVTDEIRQAVYDTVQPAFVTLWMRESTVAAPEIAGQ